MLNYDNHKYQTERKRVTVVTPTPAELRMQQQLDELMRKLHRVMRISQRTETRMLKGFAALGVDIDEICLLDEEN